MLWQIAINVLLRDNYKEVGKNEGEGEEKRNRPWKLAGHVPRGGTYTCSI